jgi:predicted RNA-binding protein
MCQATVYLGEEKVMEDVIWVEPVTEGILIRTFFEAPIVVKGEIKGIDLLKHRILLAPLEERQLTPQEANNV